MSEFTIRVTDLDNQTARYSYELRTSDSECAGPLEQEHTVNVSQPLVRDYCRLIDAAATASLDGGDDCTAELATYGKGLYDALFVPLSRFSGRAPDLIARLRDIRGPLLISTNDRVVPWELLHDGEDFFGLTQDIGRQSRVEHAFVQGRPIRGIGSALIVADPLGDLTAAEQEGRHVSAWLAGHGAKADLLTGADTRLADIMLKLQSPSCDLFHFCGHVASSSASSGRHTSGPGLLLSGRALLNDQALQALASAGAPPIVFINGCNSAVGHMANVCVSFMMLGSKAIVGTRHEVREPSAKRFAEEFYTHLLNGESTAQAIRSARLALFTDHDPGWASFILYGDPSVRIVGERSSDPGNGEPQRPRSRPVGSGWGSGNKTGDVTPVLHAEAARALDVVVRSAGHRGIVTSLDLFAGLVSSGNLRRWVETQIGKKQTATVVGLLRLVLSNAPPAEAGSQLRFSDTVNGVLARAATIALNADRAEIAKNDLDLAFAEVGGGSSAHILEMCGVSMARLAEQASSGDTRSIGAFDDDGVLRAAQLTPRANGALITSYLLARALGRPISSDLLVIGLLLAGEEELGRRLASPDDSTPGELDRLLGSLPHPEQRHCSARVREAVECAFGCADGDIVTETGLLQALVSDDASGACALLGRLGVDLGDLRTELARRTAPARSGPTS